jgi:hypothetical protein
VQPGPCHVQLLCFRMPSTESFRQMVTP